MHHPLQLPRLACSKAKWKKWSSDNSGGVPRDLSFRVAVLFPFADDDNLTDDLVDHFTLGTPFRGSSLFFNVPRMNMAVRPFRPLLQILKMDFLANRNNMHVLAIDKL
ncbi:hypothetical protein CEXT_138151, partial [Caerostris extrusa]